MTRFVVLGGGIAGVCCALELARCLKQENETHAERCIGDGAAASGVVLISASPVIKGVREVARLGRLLEELEVVETDLSQLAADSGGALQVVQGAAQALDLQRQVVRLAGGREVAFDKLCICTGARPRELAVPGADHPAVMTLRDTDSVQELARRLRSCRRLVLVGNGGIALELAGVLAGTEGQGVVGTSPSDINSSGTGASSTSSADGRELVWVLKHGHIGDAFFDLDAAAFLLQRIAPAAAAVATVGGSTGAAAEAAAVAAADPVASTNSAEAPPYAPAEALAQAPKPPAASLLQVPAANTPGWRGVGGHGEVGHAAGPAWTRELMRGLTRQQHSAGRGQVAPEQQAASAYEPKATGEAGAACSSGRGSGGALGHNPTLKVEREAGPACAAAAGVGEGFLVRLEFSSTVTHIAHGGRQGGADQPAAEQQHPPTAPGLDCEGGTRRGDGGTRSSAEPWPLHITLSNGKVLGADLVVVGIGVDPHTAWLPPELARGPDGGLQVGADMRTSHPAVWAAGDCCSCEHWCAGSGAGAGAGSGAGAAAGGGAGADADGWSSCAQVAGPHWFQHRLWTQARVMGTYAARCMAGLSDELASGFNFELFTHVTRFLGRKVVLLGLYNGQRLEQERAEDVRLYSREGEAEDGSGPTFVRVLLLRGRLQGAVLIGETGLEEALENLILDGLDLSPYGPAILDPDFELEHVFD